MAVPPEVLWAQRSNASDAAKNVLYLSVKIADSKNLKVDLTKDHLHIESDSEDYDSHYVLDVDFFQEVDPALSHHYQNGYTVYFVIRKAVKQAEYWPRLTKEKAKYFYIKTDFDKWVDEDEQEEHEADDEAMMPPLGGDNMWGNMMNENPELAAQMAGGMGGMGGMGDFDLSKLAAMGGAPGAPGATASATEADFSSSDEEEAEEAEASTDKTA